MSRSHRLWRCLLGLGLALSTTACAQPAGPRSSPSSRPLADVSVDASHLGRAIPTSFFGLGFEYNDILNYTGRGGAPDPVLVQLLRNLDAFGAGPLVLRIGGNSTDDSWWDPDGAPAPPGITYNIGRPWLLAVAAATTALRARLIVGLNLGLNDPGVGVAWAAAARTGLGSEAIEAFEIGNEPNLYPGHAYGAGLTARPATYTFGDYEAEYRAYASALRRALGAQVPLAGPAVLTPSWMANLPGFLGRQAANVDLVTYHQYPLSVCGQRPGQAGYPTIPELLANQASHGLAAEVAPFVREAAAAARPLRVDEVNSVVCLGAAGVSDRFASALWIADLLFEYAAVGVAGVNVQTIARAHYTPFTVGPGPAVNPEYYGLLLAAQAMPAGTRMITPQATSSRGNVKVWGTLDPSGTLRLVLLNKDRRAAGEVDVHAHGRGAGTLSRLQAPSLDARTGVSLGGATLDGSTDGRLRGGGGGERLEPDQGTYRFFLPAGSGALLTMGLRTLP